MPPKPKVLVVGDDKPERDAVAHAFESRGFRAAVASPVELRRDAASEQPDLVLLDIGRRGEDYLKELLGGDPIGCPHILCAERPWSELRDLATKWNAVGHVCTPAKPEQIVARVEPFLVQATEQARTPAPKHVDLAALARQATRSQFVAACPFPLLVSAASVVPRPGVSKTAGVLDEALLWAMEEAEGKRGKPAEGPRVMALAVRKTTETSPDRITVGRTPDNDIVIDHATISKLHAYFVKKAGSGFELGDAGSHNGTWLRGQLLPRNGPSSPVIESGDTVGFGELKFTFQGSSASWDLLRVHVK